MPPYRPDPRDESPEHTARITETIGWALTVDELPQLDEQRAEVLARRAARPDFTAMSDVELFRFAEPLLTTRQQELMAEHMFITAVGSIPIGIVGGTAAAVGDPGLGVRAIAGLGEVDSAAPVWALWELSRLVAASRRAGQAFAAASTACSSGSRRAGGADAAAFLAGFDDFLRQHGSRCVSEWDLGVLAWESDPTVPLTAIDRMRLLPDDASPSIRHARLAADREAAGAELLAALAADPEAQGQVAAALRAAGALAAGSGAVEDHGDPPAPRGPRGAAGARPADGGAPATSTMPATSRC